MKVYINSKDGKRKLVEVELITENAHTLIVRLPDGNIIRRNRKRDLPNV